MAATRKTFSVTIDLSEKQILFLDEYAKSKGFDTLEELIEDSMYSRVLYIIADAREFVHFEQTQKRDFIEQIKELSKQNDSILELLKQQQNGQNKGN